MRPAKTGVCVGVAITLAVILFASGPVAAAVTLVQKKTAGGTNGSVSATYDATPTANNLLIAIFG